MYVFFVFSVALVITDIVVHLIRLSRSPSTNYLFLCGSPVIIILSVAWAWRRFVWSSCVSMSKTEGKSFRAFPLSMIKSLLSSSRLIFALVFLCTVGRQASHFWQFQVQLDNQLYSRFQRSCCTLLWGFFHGFHSEIFSLATNESVESVPLNAGKNKF